MMHATSSVSSNGADERNRSDSSDQTLHHQSRKQSLHNAITIIGSRTAVPARNKTDDSEASHIDANTSFHKTQHTPKAPSSRITIMQFLVIFALLRTVMSCKLSSAGAGQIHLFERYEFKVDHPCQPTESLLFFHDTSSTVMHLRGGALSRECYSRTEFSHASAVSLAPCARHCGGCAPTSSDVVLSPPLHESMSDPMLQPYHDGRAAARTQHGRRPKLSRSVEVDNYE